MFFVCRSIIKKEMPSIEIPDIDIPEIYIPDVPEIYSPHYLTIQNHQILMFLVVPINIVI